jgi:hypothetical protein
MEQHWVFLVGGSLALLVFAFSASRRFRNTRAWCKGTQLVAQKYRLKYHPVRGFLMAQDTAFGDHAGLSFTLEVDTESRGFGDNSRDYHYAKTQVEGDWSSRLRIAPRGTREKELRATKTVDYGARKESSADSIDETFDQVVEVHGANAATIEALRSSDLRTLVLGLIPLDVRVEDGTATLRSRKFPKTPKELVDRVDALVAVAGHLRRLG